MNCSQRLYTVLMFGAILLRSLLAPYVTVAQPLQPVYFDQVVEKRFGSEGWSFEKFCPVSTDVVSRRVLQSYGAMFVASDSIKVPSTCVHRGEGDQRRYQTALDRRPLEMNGARIDLQNGAAASLEAVIAEVSAGGSSISPLDGSIAGGRTYGDTLMLWNSRVFPAMDFWIRRGRLPDTARDEIARLELPKKVEKILEWESQGIYFSPDRSRSILTSTAPPGTSQHLAMIAFDVVEFRNPTVRAVLNKNGWFQTIVDDPAHFTYLGFPEIELPSRGLLAVFKGGQLCWIPNMLPRPAGSAVLESLADLDDGTRHNDRITKERSTTRYQRCAR